MVSSYSELIKNFEKIRELIREFYVYGFKSREQYSKKSARSYDNERRRIESWLGEYIKFVRTAGGKNFYLSVDSREVKHNPLYKAFKSKSFTDGDITLHFILFDILYDPDSGYSIREIMEKTDEYLSCFEAPMVFDESTVRKKLKEYIGLGLITAEKSGRQMIYKRTRNIDIADMSDALDFFSETAPCGVIGSFMLDKTERHEGKFTFKHHYITSAIDSDVIAELFLAMREQRAVTVINMSRRSSAECKNRIIPLRIFISVQSGRQYLLAYQPDFDEIKSFRVDYIKDVVKGEKTPRFGELRAELDRMQKKMWGVTANEARMGCEKCGYVGFTVRIADDEEYIARRLEREKRIGTVTRIDAHTLRFFAEVYDVNEMIPWIRTFICRITDMEMSDKAAEERFRKDIVDMYRMYGIE